MELQMDRPIPPSKQLLTPLMYLARPTKSARAWTFTAEAQKFYKQKNPEDYNSFGKSLVLFYFIAK